MINITAGNLTPVHFLGKEVWVSFVSYERTDNDWFTVNIYVPDVAADLKLRGTLQQIAKVLDDEVSVTFA